ncbi:MAG: Spore coat polysaccharide biosynthesis protein spsK [uncultured bacterium]|nr:MAG: Spore coat polysaccharide biosynthesis protein spsK [uncultured bacterium]
MKICIIGSNGQLGSDLCLEINNHEIIPLTHKDIEIKDEKNCFDIITGIKPDIIINTAAFHNVPKCDTEPENATAINIIGAKNLACIASKINAELIHISTDYVFDGKKNSPYLETDTPNPLNFYAITKLAGELAVQDFCDRYKIIRVGGIYGVIPCRAKGGTNFVASMLKLAGEKDELEVVADEIITPTNTKDIARQIKALLNIDEYGIYHVSNGGSCSWFEFAREIFDYCKIKIKLIPIPAERYPSTIKRPRYSVLENSRTKKLSVYLMPHWKEALISHLETLFPTL